MANTIDTSNRLTGMYSGLDTDALVKALVSTQQRKTDVLAQNKTRAEWKRDLYTDFNNQLRIFREEYGSAVGASSMISKGTFFSNTVDMADNASVNVSATASARAGAYSVRVDQVATATSMNGAKATTGSLGLTAAALEKTPLFKLTSLSGGAFGAAESIEFSINGKTFSFSGADSLKSVMDRVNKSDAGVTMSYSQVSDSFTIASKTMGAPRPLADPGAAPEVPEPFGMTQPVRDDYTNGEDYEAALSDYNEARAEYAETVAQPYQNALGDWQAAKAEYDLNAKRDLQVEDTTGFLSRLGMSAVTAGQDAVVSINGVARTSATNTLQLDGIDFTFLSPTAAGKTVDLSVKRSQQVTTDRVKKFVDAFNELVGKLFTAVSQKKNYSYSPLTDEQRKELGEDGAKLWDEKAKAGMMYRDASLTKLLSDLRTSLTETLGGEGKLSDIGITVSKYAVGEPFQLEINAEKLSSALSENPEKIYGMFAAPAAGSDKGGLLIRMNAAMTAFTTKTKSNELQNLNSNIDAYAKNIKAQDDKIAKLSEKYYLQYSKLETALGQLQSQQSQLGNLFGTGQ